MKVLVAERGEIAVRVLRTCRELGLETAAVFSEADREAPHVLYADEAYCIGAPPAEESYLRVERIVEAARASGAQIVHPGCGLLAGSPALARACAEAGLSWVGPRPETLELLADEAAVRRLAGEAGLSPFPNEGGIDNARYIEVQVLADSHGHVVHLGEREGSIQWRGRKMVEESPSRALDDALRERICTAALRLATALGYVGAGAVEFLLAPDGQFYFVAVDPCLSVGHAVSEAVTGIDIVKAQLRIAASRELPVCQDEVQFRGWALACRILAEDPLRGFAPCAGRISRLREAGGPGIRIDSGVYEGMAVTPVYDALLAHLVAWGETRGVAIVRMRRALEEYQIVGVTTNLELLRALLDSHRFFGGQFHTRFLEEQFHLTQTASADHLAAALAAVLLDWRRQTGARGEDQVLSRWKMLGRWEQVGGGRW